MLYQKQFSFGILMVRRKKIQKGCRIREKMQKKSETERGCVINQQYNTG